LFFRGSVLWGSHGVNLALHQLRTASLILHIFNFLLSRMVYHMHSRKQALAAPSIISETQQLPSHATKRNDSNMINAESTETSQNDVSTNTGSM
jgi:hypothetical protein